VLGLSGRDGSSDEGLFVSSVEVGGESVELAVVLEVAAVARAVILVVIPWFQDQDALSLPVEPPRSHGLGGDTVVMLGYILSQHLMSMNEMEG
jgi:hypothetical protein